MLLLSLFALTWTALSTEEVLPDVVATEVLLPSTDLTVSVVDRNQYCKDRVEGRGAEQTEKCKSLCDTLSKGRQCPQGKTDQGALIECVLLKKPRKCVRHVVEGDVVHPMTSNINFCVQHIRHIKHPPRPKVTSDCRKGCYDYALIYNTTCEEQFGPPSDEGLARCVTHNLPKCHVSWFIQE